AMAHMLRNRRDNGVGDTLAAGNATLQPPQGMTEEYGRAPLLPPEVRVPAPGNEHLATGPVRRVDVTGNQVRGGAQTTHTRPVALLPEIVRHVWTIKDFAGTKARLEKLLPADARCTMQKLGDDRFSLNAELQDKQLQELVNGFSKSGWGLVSANLPQPGGGARVRFLGRKVLYNAELVKVK
ncbi:MAG: hypothetical protein KAI66_08465, partial [Lentisphaeria bacterium]|nr:hypothetical protein [Lentisphaeria bacterium]